MDEKNVPAVIEAILFAAGYPIEREKLIASAGCDEDGFDAAIGVLNAKYGADSGVRLIYLDGKYQLCTSETCIDAVREALGIRRGGNLSRSSLEVLAVIAYNQPTTRIFVEQVRGVDCTYTISSLLEKGLIEVCGKVDAPGRPSLYKTTDDFLRVFGLSSIHDLPPFEVFDENGQVTLKPV